MSVSTARAATRSAVIPVASAGAAAALHRLGSLPALRLPSASLAAWSLWLRSTPAEPALAAILRLAALALSYWVAASSTLYLVAKLGRLPAAARAVGWATLPQVRRAIDAAAAISLSAGLLATPARAEVPTPPWAPAPSPAATAAPAPGQAQLRFVRGGPSSAPGAPAPSPAGDSVAVQLDYQAGGPASSPPASPRPALPPGKRLPAAASPAPHGANPPPSAHTPPPDPNRTPYTVVRGDNLWSIAASHAPAGASTQQIARYWLKLIQANRSHLRSGNPSLIFPGETIYLTPAQGTDGH